MMWGRFIFFRSAAARLRALIPAAVMRCRRLHKVFSIGMQVPMKAMIYGMIPVLLPARLGLRP
jgi:hypothetical protein